MFTEESCILNLDPQYNCDNFLSRDFDHIFLSTTVVCREIQKMTYKIGAKRK